MRASLRFIFLTTLGPALLLSLRAQDLRQVQPEPAPAMPPAAATPSTIVPTPEAVSRGLAAADRVRLSGIVLLSAPDQATRTGWSPETLTGTRIDSSRLPWLAPEEVARVLGPALGQPFTDTLLRAIPGAVARLAQAAGRPFVSITLPPQDLTAGVLQVLVIEGRLGRITVEGEKYFPEKSYLALMRAQPGESIDATQLDADLAAIAANPFRQATVAAKPGAVLGTTDLVLQANDRFPWRFYAGYDDTGNRTTGLERVNAGLNWGNAFGRAHLVNYQLTASPDFARSVSHAANYTIPLRGGRSLNASYTYGKIQPDMPAPFDQTGRSTNSSLRFRQPLPKWGAVTQALSLGADYKRSDNNLLFAEIPVSGNVTHVHQFAAGYEASCPDRLGSTSFNATLLASPGGLDDKNQAAAFNGSRNGAKSQYAYLNLDLNRRTQLPRKFTLQTSISAQVATTNLLGSEQFTLGGAYTVRGYDDGDTYGDWGLLVRNELYFPAVRGLSRWFKTLPADQSTPLVFLDAGVTGPTDPQPGETTASKLGSIGTGFRYSLSRYGSVRADYGWQLRDSTRGLPVTGRLHLAASFSY